MPEYLEFLILFGVGAAAGVINVMAGGGSALTLPALIFLGLDSSLANGTNRVGIFIQSVTAAFSYHRDKVTDYRMSLRLSLLTLPGAILGAFLAVNISNELFERLLGIVMIGIIISMFVPQGGRAKAGEAVKNGWLIYPSMFAIGFYGGFIQVGVGFLIMAALYHILKLDLVLVNVHKVFIVLIYTVPALLIFIWTANVDWKLGIGLAAGNALGGWWAARASVRGGEKIVRYVLILAIFIMALKLLGIF